MIRKGLQPGHSWYPRLHFIKGNKRRANENTQDPLFSSFRQAITKQIRQYAGSDKIKHN